METIKINTINFLKNEYFDYKLHESPLLYGDAMSSPIDSGVMRSAQLVLYLNMNHHYENLKKKSRYGNTIVNCLDHH